MTRPAAAVIRRGDMPRISRAGGAETTRMVTPECGAGAFLNGFTEIPPNGAIPLHHHNCEESVLIVAGRAVVESGGSVFDADTGDVVWQPEGVPHRFINPSETGTLLIFWTYSSVDATRTLAETNETRPILAESG